MAIPVYKNIVEWVVHGPLIVYPVYDDLVELPVLVKCQILVVDLGLQKFIVVNFKTFRG